MMNEKDKRLPEDMGFDPKTNRLYILLDGYGWVYIPFDDGMFRTVWRKYFEAKKILRGEDVVEDFELEE